MKINLQITHKQGGKAREKAEAAVSGYKAGSGESPSNVTYTGIYHALLLEHKDLSLVYAHMAQTI